MPKPWKRAGAANTRDSLMPTEEPVTKQCSRCLQTLPIGEFRRSNRQQGKSAHHRQQGPWVEISSRCIVCKKKDNADWYHQNQPVARRQAQLRQNAGRNALRLAVLQHYGGACEGCGEDFPLFLSIDHTEGNGRTHCQETGAPRGGIHLYKWLQQNGFPPGFRVLCCSCNMAVRFFGQDIEQLRAALDAHRRGER